MDIWLQNYKEMSLYCLSKKKKKLLGAEKRYSALPSGLPGFGGVLLPGSFFPVTPQPRVHPYLLRFVLKMRNPLA